MRWMWLVVFIAVFWFWGRGIWHESDRIARNTLSTIAYPVVKLYDLADRFFAEKRDNRLSRFQMVRQLERGRELQKKMFAEIVSLRQQLEFASQIQELLDFKQRYVMENAVLGQVILKTIASHEHSFLVDKGSRHGVERDMVALYHNCLIGRVIDVFPCYCKVMLLTDARCKIAAEIEGSPAEGILQGMYDPGYATLLYVDHLQKITPGASIFSSGQGLIFPKGFLLGTIATCAVGAIYHTVTVKLPFNVSDISYCYLTKKDG